MVIFISQFWLQLKEAFYSTKQLSANTVLILGGLSFCNWGIETVKWHWVLRYKGIAQSIATSLKQVLTALPYALVFGKIAGTSAGRLMHFRGNSLMAATRSQLLSSCYQSAALIGFLIFGLAVELNQNAIVFAGVLATILCFICLNFNVVGLLALSAIRTAIIFISFIWLLPGGSALKLVSVLAKTFSVLTFVPFTPLANLGPKEWLMHYFYNDIALQDYLAAGLLVFTFNNLMPAVLGIFTLIFAKWK
jgi:hypothetical protein